MTIFQSSPTFLKWGFQESRALTTNMKKKNTKYLQRARREWRSWTKTGSQYKRTQVSFSSGSSNVPGRNWIHWFQISQRNQVSDTHRRKYIRPVGWTHRSTLLLRIWSCSTWNFKMTVNHDLVKSLTHFHKKQNCEHVVLKQLLGFFGLTLRPCSSVLTCFRGCSGFRLGFRVKVRIRFRLCVLLLSQLLDEDGDSWWVGSYFLDKGVVVLPLRLQTHLKHRHG